MDKDQLISAIRYYCKEHANPENVKKSQRYFKEEFHGYGMTTPEIRSFVKEMLTDPDVTLPVLLKASKPLLSSVMYEEAALLLLLINGRGKQFTRETFDEVADFYASGVTNWAHADILGMYILPQFFRRKIIEVQDFSKWIRSPYTFQRRSVPVTLIKHLKANRTASFQPVFSFLEPLMSDQKREVHQGMGWFLREAWKIQQQPTEDFLLQWKDSAPRLIIQYATERMTKENKERFKRVNK